jgi:hypothetical protein
MVPPVVASLPHLRPDNSRKRSAEGQRRDADHLGEFQYEYTDQREQPEFLCHHPADQRRKAVFRDVVGGHVEVFVLFAGIVRKCSQQRTGDCFVPIDPVRVRYQIQAEIAVAAERICVVVDAPQGRVRLVLLLGEHRPDETMTVGVASRLFHPAENLDLG